MLHLEPSILTTDIQVEGSVYVHNAQVVIKRPVSYSPSVPVILLVGSALEFEGSGRKLAAAQQLANYARLVAQCIAKLGFSIINGACPGLPDAMMLDYNKYSSHGISIGISAYSTPLEHLAPKPFAPNGFPLSADITVFTSSSFEFLNVINTKYCDAVIVLGGGLGSLIEAATAVEEEVPVYCITPSGGIAGRLDDLLKDFIASFKSYNAHVIHSIAQLEESLCKFHDQRKALNLKSRSAGLIEQIATRKLGAKCCVIDIEKGLSKISYSFGSLSVEINQPPCLIDRAGLFHESYDAEGILYALDNYDRKYIYDGVSLVISHNELKSVWGPSFDTLLLAETLSIRAQRQSSPVISEFGCGSGFLAAWCIKYLQPHQLQIVDSSSEAIACAQRTLADKAATVDVSYYLSRLSAEGAPGPSGLQAADLVVCTPPSLPNVAMSGQIADAFSGMSLLLGLLHNYQHYIKANGRMYFTASSISFLDDTVRKTISRMRNEGILELVNQEYVPFKISEVILNSDLMNKLCSEEAIITNYKKLYKYWHKVYVFELDRSKEIRS